MITATRVRAVKAYSDLIATWVTILGAFVGGIWALGEYRDKVRDDEVAATLRYQQQYNTTPMWEIRGRLETFWESRSKDIFDATAKGENVISDYVVKTLGADKTALADTGATIDFFAGLGTCLCAGLCNPQSAIQLFGKDADDFYELNYPYIQAQRKNLRDQNYAAGLTIIATAYRSGQSAIEKTSCPIH